MHELLAGLATSSKIVAANHVAVVAGVDNVTNLTL